VFSFTKYKNALDWYHLVKKFREYYGMAFRGKEADAGVSKINNMKYLEKLTLFEPGVPVHRKLRHAGLSLSMKFQRSG
jgi:hypothetical protein